VEPSTDTTSTQRFEVAASPGSTNPSSVDAIDVAPPFRDSEIPALSGGYLLALSPTDRSHRASVPPRPHPHRARSAAQREGR
jgi:hypothetical protein